MLILFWASVWIGRLRRHVSEEAVLVQLTRATSASYWYWDSETVSCAPKDWDSAAAA